MLRRLTFALCACLGAAALARAQSPELKLPAFADLKSHATETVDISIGALPLKLAGWIAGQDTTDADSAAVGALLKGLHTLRVRHYEFASEFAYPQAEVDAVRAQLAAAGWNQLVQVRDQNKEENVDVYLAVDKERITGVAIVASEPREFTIVHAIGSLDLAQVEKLRQHFEFHHDGVHHDATARVPPWPALL